MTNQITTQPVLKVKGLEKHFDISGHFLDRLTFAQGRPRLKKTLVQALSKVSFEIHKGEIFSVVGESGCGKSTLGRTILGLYPPNKGQIFFKGQRIDHLNAQEMLPVRARMQMIFQDPYASLNPRMRIHQILSEPVTFHYPHLTPGQVREKVVEMMELVGIDPAWGKRFPHEFSGGQRQRISIARALVMDPEFIVADEPISALDVSIQAQILNLLMEAQEQKGLTYLFVTHDLSVVEHISSRVAVMYLGAICELAPTRELFTNPLHPYTQALLSAIPRLGEKGLKHIKLKGEVPTPINLPQGCFFQTRCLYARAICKQVRPEFKTINRNSKSPPVTSQDTFGQDITQQDSVTYKNSSHLAACHGLEQGWL